VAAGLRGTQTNAAVLIQAESLSEEFSLRRIDDDLGVRADLVPCRVHDRGNQDVQKDRIGPIPLGGQIDREDLFLIDPAAPLWPVAGGAPDLHAGLQRRAEIYGFVFVSSSATQNPQQ
jgi:hypothetical protein